MSAYLPLIKVKGKLKKFFLDLFFPKKCLGCGCPDTYLCRDCFVKIQTTTNFICKDRIISAVDYANPLVRDLIKALKYHYVQELAKPLSQLMIKTLESLNLGVPIYNFIIIPVPLHKFRLRNRGFNQAELLAREIADYFKLPIKTDTLQRIKPTEIQAEIKNDEERKNNVKDAFKIENSEAIKDKNILLIDDVVTSAATLSEAVKVLKLNGAKEIWALTVARG